MNSTQINKLPEQSAIEKPFSILSKLAGLAQGMGWLSLICTTGSFILKSGLMMGDFEKLFVLIIMVGSCLFWFIISELIRLFLQIEQYKLKRILTKE